LLVLSAPDLPYTYNTRRPNFPVELEFRASKADNPMDIYFLFDLSGSMDDEKEQLTNISQRLAEASIQRIYKRRVG
jgi:hypothetical protein